jgi:hypothetical protein
VAEPLTLAGRAGSLTGEPAGDTVDGSEVMSANCSNVVEDGDARPSALED